MEMPEQAPCLVWGEVEVGMRGPGYGYIGRQWTHEWPGARSAGAQVGFPWYGRAGMGPATPASLLDDLMRYIRFTDEDAALMRSLAPVVRPHFARIVERFYEAIDRTPGASAVFTGGPAQIERQKQQLHGWLEGLVGGDYDDAYFERRARIGRTHVRIGLDQQYMFGAMNLIRDGLHTALEECDWDAPRKAGAHRAVDRLCDMELAIMLETYREGYIARVQDASRLAAIGQVAASIGHDLRNPLAVIQTSTHQLQRRLTDGDERVQRHLRRVADQTELCSSIISDLLELARDRAPERRPTDLGPVVREAAGSVARRDGVVLALAIADDLPRPAIDATQFRQLVVNLVQNAVEAVGERGRIVVSLRLGAGEVVLAVEDDGPGLRPAVLARLFEPLFTTRANGTGLGLALCRRIVEKHGGTITADNRPDGGASFTAAIPVGVDARAEAPA
jgi:signal transduction histidine kinase